MTHPFIQMMRASAEADDDEPPARQKISREGEIENLRCALRSLQTVNTFAVGMIVRQKPSCRLYRDAGDNGLSIVVEILPKAVIGNAGRNDDSGSPYYQHHTDMRIGQWDKDGDFVVFHVDSTRFEPAPNAEE